MEKAIELLGPADTARYKVIRYDWYRKGKDEDTVPSDFSSGPSTAPAGLCSHFLHVGVS